MRWVPFRPISRPPGFEKAGYGRFRFAAEKVVNRNCVFRHRDKAGIAPGEYRYRVVVGSRGDVRKDLESVVKLFAKDPRP